MNLLSVRMHTAGRRAVGSPPLPTVAFCVGPQNASTNVLACMVVALYELLRDRLLRDGPQHQLAEQRRLPVSACGWKQYPVIGHTHVFFFVKHILDPDMIRGTHRGPFTPPPLFADRQEEQASVPPHTERPVRSLNTVTYRKQQR